MTRKHALSCAFAVLAVAAMLAACSSTKSASSSSSTSSSPLTSGSTGATATGQSTGTASSGQPIKIGVVCSCSGQFIGSAEIPVKNTYEAWASQVNASGGINGHPVQVILKDDTNTPGISVTDVQTLISDHVDAIVSMSDLDEDWASKAQAADIPVVGANIVDAPFDTNPDFYPEGETASNENVAYIGTVKATGSTNFGVMYCAEAPQCAESVTQLKGVGQKHGEQLVYSAAISATAPNYTAQCLAAQQNHVQALIIEDNTPEVTHVATDCHQQGYNPIYINGFTSIQPSALTTAWGKKAWLWSDLVPYFVNTSGINAMNAAVNKYYPGLLTNTTLWTEAGLYGWASGLLLEDAVKAGGLSASSTPSAAEITNGLHSLKGDNLNGFYAPLTFTPRQPNPQSCFFTLQVQNGKEISENNNQTTCESS
jgi:branched-chain amino acid transport system substrate-binding protein